MVDSVVKDQPGEGRLVHAPSDHPAVPPAKVGVVLANLGTGRNRLLVYAALP